MNSENDFLSSTPLTIKHISAIFEIFHMDLWNLTVKNETAHPCTDLV